MRNVLCFLALFIAGCGQGNSPTDTPTSGSIAIAADDSYKPIVDAEINVFEALYPNAKIQTHYEAEDSTFKELLADSVRLIVVNRKLTKAEEDYFHGKQLFPEQVKVATDALAFIVNNNCPDTLLTLSRIKAVFSGQDTTWNAIVFDHDNSGNARYIQQNILSGQPFPKFCFAVHSNPQVIDYVSKNPKALGVIGVNWISDDYDSTVVKFLKKVKVVAVSGKDSKNPADFHQPYQAYMKMEYYPLCRDIYIISREARTGLGSGFLSFVASDRGQRIILREGILPAAVPTHVIKF